MAAEHFAFRACSLQVQVKGNRYVEVARLRRTCLPEPIQALGNCSWWMRHLPCSLHYTVFAEGRWLRHGTKYILVFCGVLLEKSVCKKTFTEAWPREKGERMSGWLICCTTTTYYISLSFISSVENSTNVGKWSFLGVFCQLILVTKVLKRTNIQFQGQLNNSSKVLVKSCVSVAWPLLPCSLLGFF